MPTTTRASISTSFNRRARKGPVLPPALPRHARISGALLAARGGRAAAAGRSTRRRDLGFMLWDIDHAGDRASLFFRARLENGVMTRAAARLAGDPAMSVLAALVRAYERLADRGDVPPFGYSTEKIGFLIALARGRRARRPADRSARRRGQEDESPRLMAVSSLIQATGRNAPIILSLGQHRLCSRRHRWRKQGRGRRVWQPFESGTCEELAGTE